MSFTASRLRGPRTGIFLDWYAAEDDNLRAVLDRLAELAPDEAARAAYLLSPYWIARSALDFASHAAMRYPSVVDDLGKTLRRYNNGPPVTLLVNPAGTVVYVKRGPYLAVATPEGIEKLPLVGAPSASAWMELKREAYEDLGYEIVDTGAIFQNS